MAGEIIRPADLTTERTSPVASEFMVVDNGVTVAKSKIVDVVNSGRPVASQAEAEAGTDATKAMAPLTTKQAIYALGDARFASTAQGVPAGGTTGQALVKTSGDDFDTEWGDVAVSDGDKGDVDVSGTGTVWRIPSGAFFVTTRVALKALDTTTKKTVVLTEAGREGIFLWKTGDYSAQITTDTAEGVYIEATAIASTSGAWVRVYDRLLATYFGASPSAAASANVTAFQAAITFAEIYGGALHIPGGVYALNAGLIIAATINLTGDGMNKTNLTFTHSGAASYGIKFEPDARSNNNTFSSWSGFMVTAASASYGILINLTGSEYLSNWTMERVYTIGSTNGMRCLGTGITGGMFSCTIRRCWIANGLYMSNVGDSITIIENTINGNGIGIFATLIGGARQLVIRNNNITTLSENVYLSGVFNAQVDSNWMETPSYLGSYTGASGALCYLENCSETRLTRNTIQPLDEVGGGFVGANYCVTVAGTGDHNIIDDNDLSDGVVGHVNLTAVSITNTLIGPNNRFAEAAVITDNAAGTMGVNKTPSLSGTWVAYGASYTTFDYKKDGSKIVRIIAAIKSGSSGSTIATLPAGFRPALQKLVQYYNPVDNTLGYLLVSSLGVVTHSSGTVTGVFFNTQFEAA